MIIDFSNPWVFIVWYFITAGLLFASYKTKKSKICLVPVFYFILILGLHLAYPDWIKNVTIHRVFNFLGLATSLSMFVVMDEVETRRKVISQVFKNRYKKGEDKIEEQEEEE